VRQDGALAGVRVLDWTDESGRLAGKLLAEAGAEVLRLRSGAPGESLGEAMAHRGGLLDWWFDAGTRLLPLDLETPEGRSALAALVPRADILLETAEPARQRALGLDPGSSGRCIRRSCTSR
jgi:crotonobetainyl-CoA:carnitine CoA-transferase CaiB-like acyl-CoA transferase